MDINRKINPREMKYQSINQNECEMMEMQEDDNKRCDIDEQGMSMSMSMSMSMGKPIYKDELIEINEKCLMIKKYYYPLNKIKIIPLTTIQKIELIKMNRMSGKYTFYGFCWKFWWFHLDRKRPSKDFCIVIHDNSTIKPAITPVNAEEAYRILLSLIKK